MWESKAGDTGGLEGQCHLYKPGTGDDGVSLLAGRFTSYYIVPQAPDRKSSWAIVPRIHRTWSCRNSAVHRNKWMTEDMLIG